MPVKIIPTYKVTIKAGILGGGSGFVSWDAVLSKPATFPPSAHNHTMAEVVGLNAALTGINANVSNVYTKAEANATFISKPASATANQVLTFDGGLWAAKPTQKPTAGDITTALGYTPANPAAVSMAGLADVTFSGLSDGDLVVYNSQSSKWQNIQQSKITDGGNF